MSREATRVLIVEDKKDLATAYSKVLSKEYDVTTAIGGAQALEMVDESADIVLLDRRMPGISGDEVLATIRDRGLSVAVGLITAVEPAADILEMDLDEYVLKPIDNEELLTLVAELVHRRACSDDLRKYFALASKRWAFEHADRQDSAVYETLTDRLEQARQSLDTDPDAASGPADPRTREW